MKQYIFLNNLNWYCIEPTFRNLLLCQCKMETKLSETCTLPETQWAVLGHLFMAWEQSQIAIVGFCSLRLNFFCYLHLL